MKLRSGPDVNELISLYLQFYILISYDITSDNKTWLSNPKLYEAFINLN